MKKRYFLIILFLFNNLCSMEVREVPGLPIESWDHIFSFLDFESIKQVRASCGMFSDILFERFVGCLIEEKKLGIFFYKAKKSKGWFSFNKNEKIDALLNGILGYILKEKTLESFYILCENRLIKYLPLFMEKIKKDRGEEFFKEVINYKDSDTGFTPLVFACKFPSFWSKVKRKNIFFLVSNGSLISVEFKGKPVLELLNNSKANKWLKYLLDKYIEEKKLDQ